MPVQTWEAVLNSGAPYQTTDGAAYTASTTITDVSPAPQITLPANYYYVGQVFRATAFGLISGVSGINLTMGFYYGGVAGTALLTSGAITTTTAATAWPWHMEAWVEVKTLGSSGTVWSKGWLDLPTSLTAIARTSMPATQTQPITVDTTTAKAITAGATWGTNSASNTLTLEGYPVSALN